MDLALITNENKSHYFYIKGFDRLKCSIRQNIKIKNTFVLDIVYNVLVVTAF